MSQAQVKMKRRHLRHVSAVEVHDTREATGPQQGHPNGMVRTACESSQEIHSLKSSPVTTNLKKAGLTPTAFHSLQTAKHADPAALTKKRPIETIGLSTDDEGTPPPRWKKRTAFLIGDATKPVRKRQKQREAQVPELKECILCCEELQRIRFPVAPHHNASDCHGNVCFSCWELHLEHEVKSSSWNNIKCPECATVLIEEEVKVLALKDSYMS